MKKKKKKTGRRPIEAAGGIVMRGRVRPLFAVVQLRRQKTWVLPKGKLNRDETAVAAARREAIEETGHGVTVHEFLGSLVYKTSGRPKTVKFWRMEASRRPVAKLMRDVRAVRWMPLGQATARLTHERERLFLAEVGPQVVRGVGPAKRNARKSVMSRRKKVRSSRKRGAARVDALSKRHIRAPARKRGPVPTERNRPVVRLVQAETKRPVTIRRSPKGVFQKLRTFLRR